MSQPTKEQLHQLARRIEEVKQIAMEDALMLRGAVGELQQRVVILEQNLSSLGEYLEERD